MQKRVWIFFTLIFLAILSLTFVLGESRCERHVCTLYEGETLKAGDPGRFFSIDFISSKEVRLNIDNLTTNNLLEGQTQLLPNGVSVTINNIFFEFKDREDPTRGNFSGIEFILISYKFSEGKMIISEQVTCMFSDSSEIQKCTGYNGSNGELLFECSGKGSCVVPVSGEYSLPKYEFEWRSSCLGAKTDYTILDGVSEYLEFECGVVVPEYRGEDCEKIFDECEGTAEQCKKLAEECETKKAFRYAYWQCSNGEEQNWQGSETFCKSFWSWLDDARNFCSDRYSEVIFIGIREECYLGTIEEEKNYSIDEEKFLICKDSCLLDGKCYPFGYRKSGEYCSDNSEFVPQLKADAACENNFECGSNVCVSGECISQSFIQKILDFFRKLFGEK